MKGAAAYHPTQPLALPGMRNRSGCRVATVRSLGEVPMQQGAMPAQERLNVAGEQPWPPERMAVWDAVSASLSTGKESSRAFSRCKQLEVYTDGSAPGESGWAGRIFVRAGRLPGTDRSRHLRPSTAGGPYGPGRPHRGPDCPTPRPATTGQSWRASWLPCWPSSASCCRAVRPRT